MRLRAASFFAILALASCSVLVDVSGLSGGVKGAADAGQDATAIDARSDIDSTIPPVACDPATRIQSAHQSTFTGVSMSMSVVMPAIQQAGDYVVVGVNYEAACGSIMGVSDTSGNVYSALIPPLSRSGAGALETWGAANIVAASAGANVVVVTFATACKLRNVKVVEYAGIAPTDAVEGQASLAGDGGPPDASLKTSAAAVLFAHTADATFASDAGAGWSLILSDAWSTLAEDQIVGVAGTYAVTYSQDPRENWVIEAIALRTCR